LFLIVRVLAVSGSLQAQSSNQALLHAARELAPALTTVVNGPSPGALPHFNPDLQNDKAVGLWREAVIGADAVLIATPEYAHSLPGSLKNALDWLVGTGELYRKPVAVLTATPRHGGGAMGRAALDQTLRAQGADVRSSVSILVRQGPAAGDGLDGDALDAIRAALTSLTPLAAR
jgi:NAD(P)H-dependent FMN reductase